MPPEDQNLSPQDASAEAPPRQSDSAGNNGQDPQDDGGNGTALMGDLPELRQPYYHIWSDAALQLIQQLTGVLWSAETEAMEPRAQFAVELAAHWEMSGELNGKLQIKLHRNAARNWARLLLPAEKLGESSRSELNDAERGAVGEFMRRLAATVAEGLSKGGWGKVDIDVRHIGPLRRTVEDGGAEFPLRFRYPEREPLELDLSLDSALREQFRRGPRFESSTASAPAPAVPGRLDLLLDVELDVTLRFGGRQMLLHDVLELAPGSVLELDRHIDDPVELLVSGKIVAWGEVVVVDGNYGLRITRIVQRSERMAAVGVRA